jgi:hypothetical protein
LTKSANGKRIPFSTTMRMIPSAARRRAKGSREPVGFSPIDQKLVSESSLSASATAIEIGALGQRSLGPAGA